MRKGGTISGAASLIMIFCVLCLAIFAVLTLSTANQEQLLAKTTAERAKQYYEAESAAVKIVNTLQDRNQRVDGITWTPQDTGALAEFALPIDENQSLDVAVWFPYENTAAFQVVRWQTIYTGDWTTDDSIIVWDGD